MAAQWKWSRRSRKIHCLARQAACLGYCHEIPLSRLRWTKGGWWRSWCKPAQGVQGQNCDMHQSANEMTPWIKGREKAQKAPWKLPRGCTRNNMAGPYEIILLLGGFLQIAKEQSSGAVSVSKPLARRKAESPGLQGENVPKPCQLESGLRRLQNTQDITGMLWLWASGF